jgi:hypothetical protein
MDASLAGLDASRLDSIVDQRLYEDGAPSNPARSITEIRRGTRSAVGPMYGHVLYRRPTLNLI